MENQGIFALAVEHRMRGLRWRALPLLVLLTAAPYGSETLAGQAPHRDAGRIVAETLTDENDPHGTRRARQRREADAAREAERRRLLEEGRRRRAAETEKAGQIRRQADEERRERELREGAGRDPRHRPAGSPSPVLLRRTCLALYREIMVESQRGELDASVAARERAVAAGCTEAEISRVLAPYYDAMARGRHRTFDIDRYLSSIAVTPAD